MQSEKGWTIPLAIGWLILWIGGAALLLGVLDWFMAHIQGQTSILREQVTAEWLVKNWSALLALGPAFLIITGRWTSIWMAIVALVCSVPALLKIALFVLYIWFLIDKHFMGAG